MKKSASLLIDNEGKRKIKIIFPYDFPTLEKIRSLPGRKWVKENDYWICPINPTTLELLLQWGFELDVELNQVLDSIIIRRERVETKPVPGLKGTLMPFQSAGVSFIDLHNGRVLIADEMGLGKTIQALAWLQLHPESRPVVIITPSSLKINWEREIYKWMSDPNVEILSGESPYPPEKEIIIINYDILPKWVDTLIGYHYKTVITDECHFYKTNAARRTKAVKKLAKHALHFIALSGTPIENRPIEIYNAIKIINPELFPDYWYFIRRYCKATRTPFGMDVSGASNMGELHRILKTSIMIRRKKEDVLTELPPKTYSVTPMEINNRDKYREAERDFISFLRKEKGESAAERASNAETLTRISYLKNLAAEGKIQAVKAWIKDFLAVESKLVIFCEHRIMVDKLTEEFSDISVKIDGSVSQTDRQKAVDSFQEDPNVHLMIANMRAGGVGYTLTASSNVAIVEYPWNPAILDQAEDRCHRITQKNNVTVHNLVAVDTIEEKIIELIEKKRKIIGAVLDGKSYEKESILSELLKQYSL